jgi:hypothetical protein
MEKISGYKIAHSVISDRCRKSLGGVEAIEKALEMIEDAYFNYLDLSSSNDVGNFHVVLTIECNKEK